MRPIMGSYPPCYFPPFLWKHVRLRNGLRRLVGKDQTFIIDPVLDFLLHGLQERYRRILSRLGENNEAFNFSERHRQEILGSGYPPAPLSHHYRSPSLVSAVAGPMFYGPPGAPSAVPEHG